MYEFKIGDVGKTRAGKDYKVVALLNEGEVNNGDRIVAVADGHIITYQENGQYYVDFEDDPDLLPPKGRTVYLNVYPGISGHYGYDTEDEAKANANVTEAIAVAVPVELPPGI